MLKKKLLSLLMAIAIVFVPMVPAMAEETEKLPEEITITSALRQYIKNYFQFDVTDEQMLDSVIKSVLKEHPELFQSVINGIMDSLDEHSVYFTPEELGEFNAYIESEFGGIGAQLSRENGYITIVSVISGSPSEKAGLLAGDKIISVEGESIIGADTDMAVSKLRGEIGTDVTFLVLRDGVGEMEFTVTRDTIKANSVEGVVLEGTSVGYIAITTFGSTTAVEFKTKFDELTAQGADRYILDLRNNTGGLTDAACDIAALFVPKGATIFEVRSKAEGNTKYINDQDGQKQKMVVLVNEYTASASEILSGALKDNGAATLVGTKTYGKGTMQIMSSLGKYGGFKLTMAEFFSPSGNTINKVGITPDVMVKNETRPVTVEDLSPLGFTTRYQFGDEADEVFAAKQRLFILKYYNGTMDNYFDTNMEKAVETFQAANNLYPYGVLDLTTQMVLHNLAMEGEITLDTQGDKAIEVVKEM